jgi:hypothetical protein
MFVKQIRLFSIIKIVVFLSGNMKKKIKQEYSKEI